MQSLISKAGKFYRYKFKNEWPRYFILFVWILVNGFAFAIVYFQYQTKLEYFYLRKIVKNGICWSKASAICLNMNCTALLFFVCRNLISRIRNFRYCSPKFGRVLDKHITFHQYCGYMVIFFGIIHTMGHIYNLESFVVARDSKKSDIIPEADDLSGLLSILSHLKEDVYLNPVKTDNSLPIVEAVKMLPGITGILMCLCLGIIVSTSFEFVRRLFFNIFLNTHRLMGASFYLFFIVHGLQKVVRKQTNTDANNPEKCYKTWSDWPQPGVCDLPEFDGNMASSWIWVFVPILIYSLERLIRFIRSLRQYDVDSYVLHPSNVLELIIDNTNPKKMFKYRSGQYLYLNVQSISYFEWHPFTITSAPNDKNLTVHIRLAGDWTSQLHKSIVSPSNNNKQPAIKHISLDGPYGTCAEDVFKYEKVVLIGAGIGITPYASIIKNINYKCNKVKSTTLLKKVHFFWICPSIDTFEWFGSMMCDLEREMVENSRGDFLEYKLYLTRGWSIHDIVHIAENHTQSNDLFTGLQQKTNYGRPNFEQFFKEQAETPPLETGRTQKVGVFFCGPSSLSTELHKLCNQFSNQSIRFIYNKESF